MKTLFILILNLVLLSACATSGGGNGNPVLESRQGTNEVASANLNLGIEYMRAGNMDSALDRLNRALEADPNYYATHNAMALLYQRLGDPAIADRHFKRAIALNNNDSLSKNNYGSFLCQTNRYEEAEKVFLSAAANPLYETPEVAFTNAGTCALLNTQTAAAEKYFREALAINPQVPSALLQMAQISYDQSNFLNARAYLQRYQSQARHTASSLELGIKIEQQLGDKNAVSSYQMMLKNIFSDPDASGQNNIPTGP